MSEIRIRTAVIDEIPALLAAAHERFTALGGRRADAMVLDGNALGRQAWRSTGYHPEEQWTRWVKPLR
jgi:hypothetical protein